MLLQAAATAAHRISNGRKVRDLSFLGRGFRTSPDVARIALDTESFTLESPQLVVNRNRFGPPGEATLAMLDLTRIHREQ